jgi:D-alanine-D-alanine ligase
LAAIVEIEVKPPESRELKQLENKMILQTVQAPQLKEVDVVFLILHGGIGENGTIQAMLDMLGTPYTGAGVLGSAVAMDKMITKKLFLADNIPTPEYFVLSRDSKIDIDTIDLKIKSKFGYPAIFKPTTQGSSVGLTLVKSRSEIKQALDCGFEYDHELLVEKFIAGRELTVAILGDKALPIAECVPHSGLYDYEHKYSDGRTDYICPAKLDSDLASRIQAAGLKAFQTVKCHGFGRVDFRLAEDNSFYCLEVNTLPGMTSHSLVPKAAGATGMSFPKLLENICEIGIADCKAKLA